MSVNYVSLNPTVTINNFTDGYQSNSNATELADGRTLVVWNGEQESLNGYYGISGRILDSNGSPLENDFVVTETEGSQIHPNAAALPNGGFVVAWQGLGAEGRGIYLKVHSALATAETAEILVSNVSDDGAFPDISVYDDGSFIVSWRSEPKNFYGIKRDVSARYFDASGEALGDEFLVYDENNAVGQYQSNAVFSGDKAVVVWDDYISDEHGPSIYAKILDTVGDETGTIFRVNTSTNGAYDPAVAALEQGGFIVTCDLSPKFPPPHGESLGFG